MKNIQGIKPSNSKHQKALFKCALSSTSFDPWSIMFRRHN